MELSSLPELLSCRVHFCDTLTNAFARHKSLITHTEWQCQLNAWHEHGHGLLLLCLCFSGCFAFVFGHGFGFGCGFGSGPDPRLWSTNFGPFGVPTPFPSPAAAAASANTAPVFGDSRSIQALRPCFVNVIDNNGPQMAMFVAPGPDSCSCSPSLSSSQRAGEVRKKSTVLGCERKSVVAKSK